MAYVNEKLKIYREYLNGKNVSVIGVGISNIPLIGFLLDAGANVVARDAKDFGVLSANPSLNVKFLTEKGVKFVTGEKYLSDIC